MSSEGTPEAPPRLWIDPDRPLAGPEIARHVRPSGGWEEPALQRDQALRERQRREHQAYLEAQRQARRKGRLRVLVLALSGFLVLGLVLLGSWWFVERPRRAAQELYEKGCVLLEKALGGDRTGLSEAAACLEEAVTLHPGHREAQLALLLAAGEIARREAERRWLGETWDRKALRSALDRAQKARRALYRVGLGDRDIESRLRELKRQLEGTSPSNSTGSPAGPERPPRPPEASPGF